MKNGRWDAYRGPLGALSVEMVSGQASVAMCDQSEVEDVGLALAATVLCDRREFPGETALAGAESAIPCGDCESCRQVANRVHPCMRLVEPDGASLKIEQIREMQSSTARRNLSGNRLVVVLMEADRLGAQAANALLKTLEEPRSYLTFFLVTARPALLLQTVLSRCRVIRFPSQGLRASAPEVEKKAQVLLAILDQADLRAFEPVLGYLRRGKGRWDREEMADIATWLMHAYRDRWRQRLKKAAGGLRADPGDDQGAARMIPHVEWMQRQLAKNANVSLCLEGLCLRVAGENSSAV